MSDELTDKVKLQIEEILERTEKPVGDVEALVHRILEIFEKRFPIFLVAIILEALEEQVAMIINRRDGLEGESDGIRKS